MEDEFEVEEETEINEGVENNTEFGIGVINEEFEELLEFKAWLGVGDDIKEFVELEFELSRFEGFMLGGKTKFGEENKFGEIAGEFGFDLFEEVDTVLFLLLFIVIIIYCF